MFLKHLSAKDTPMHLVLPVLGRRLVARSARSTGGETEARRGY